MGSNRSGVFLGNNVDESGWQAATNKYLCAAEGYALCEIFRCIKKNEVWRGHPCCCNSCQVETEKENLLGTSREEKKKAYFPAVYLSAFILFLG